MIILQDEGIEHSFLEEIRKMIREQLEKEGPAICETKPVASDAGKAGNDVRENWRGL